MPNVRARADACPGALRTHDAADGPLARVRVPGGAVSAAQLAVLGAAARELGRDVIELTSRGNLQVRGVRDPAALAARLAAAGLLPSATHERVRNIVASPLGGRGPRGVLATDPLVTALDEALRARPELARLPGRFLFALDDGTGDMAALGADAACTPEGLRLAGTRLGPVPGEPVAALLAAAEAFLEIRGTPGASRRCRTARGSSRSGWARTCGTRRRARTPRRRTPGSSRSGTGAPRWRPCPRSAGCPPRRPRRSPRSRTRCG
ncbi:hypothetical protein ACQEU6_45745 [Spirillospora sp. CA-108201]